MEAKDITDKWIMEQTHAPLVLSGHRRLAEQAFELGKQAGVREVAETYSKGKMAIPIFNNEDEERDFWSTHDSADFLDGAKSVILKNIDHPSSQTSSGAQWYYKKWIHVSE